jgi:hypothetical protein
VGLPSEGIDRLEVRLSAPILANVVGSSSLRSEQWLVGTLIARMSAQDLLDVVEDPTGLGMTGEVVLAKWDGRGEVTVLNRLRHQKTNSFNLGSSSRDSPVVKALALRLDTVFTEGTVDYRGERVWAATRFIRELEAEFMVKVDAAEREASLRGLQALGSRTALSLAVMAVLLGLTATLLRVRLLTKRESAN